MGAHSVTLLSGNTYSGAAAATFTYDYMPNYNLGFLGATITADSTSSFTGTALVVNTYGLIKTPSGVAVLPTAASFAITVTSATATSTTATATYAGFIQTSTSQPFTIEGFRVNVIVPNVTGATATLNLKISAQPVKQGTRG